MRREDLNLRVLWVKVEGGQSIEGYRPVTDAELAELGYVKLGETVTEETWTITDEVDEADLLAQGYVKLDGIDVERGARAMYDADDAYTEPWDEAFLGVRDWYRRMAKTVIDGASLTTDIR